MNRIQAFVNLLQTPDSVEATVIVKVKNLVVQQIVLLKYPGKLILGNFHKHSQPFSNKRRTGLHRQHYYDEKGC